MKKVTLPGDICRFLNAEAQDSFRANTKYDAKTNLTTGDLAHIDRLDLIQCLQPELARIQKTKESAGEAKERQKTDTAELRAAIKALQEITPTKG